MLMIFTFPPLFSRRASAKTLVEYFFPALASSTTGDTQNTFLAPEALIAFMALSRLFSISFLLLLRSPVPPSMMTQRPERLDDLICRAI